MGFSVSLCHHTVYNEAGHEVLKPTMRRPLTFISLAVLLQACATPATDPAEALLDAQPAPAELADTLERPIPDASVYPLLVAEFALRRRNYDIALEHYLAQAPVLRDPAVSAHATHLAQYMQRDSDALAAVQLWVELEPDNLEPNNTAATLLIRQGYTLEAIPYLEKVARGGNNANFPVLLSNFKQLNADEQAQLVTAINQLAQEFPDNIQLLLTQALIFEELEQRDEALDKLKQLFALEPYQNQATLLEAKLLLENGHKKPFARLEKALERAPEDHRLRLQYARLLTRTDMQAAKEQFELLSEQSPRNAELLLSLALINREMGNNLDAKAYLRQMLKLEQEIDQAHYYLGRIAEEEEDFRGAVYEYMQVGESKDFLSATNRAGRIMFDGSDVQEGNKYFNKVRSEYPALAEQLYSMQSDLLIRTEKLEAAMAVLQQGLEEIPESAALRYARSMLGERTGDLALMEQDLRAIISQNPDNATALNALGYTLANTTDRYDEAHDLIARALELQPDEAAILDSMGWVLYHQGLYEEAITYLRRAYEQFPDAEVAAHLGEVLWVAGKPDAARLVWQEALTKTPDHEVLVKTLQRLGVDKMESPS